MLSLLLNSTKLSCSVRKKSLSNFKEELHRNTSSFSGSMKDPVLNNGVKCSFYTWSWVPPIIPVGTGTFKPAES